MALDIAQAPPGGLSMTQKNVGHQPGDQARPSWASSVTSRRRARTRARTGKFVRESDVVAASSR
jgi:hypothetical protein